MAAKRFGIIVLGCPSTYKGLPSKMFEQRCLLGEKLYTSKQNDKPVLICTGYHEPGSKESQAAAMKRRFDSAGLIPSEQVIAEEEARCTIENSVYAKSILDGLGIKDVAVVTSQFHMNRAKFIFERVMDPEYNLHFETAPDGIPEELVLEMLQRENRKMVNLRSELMRRADFN